MTSPYVSGAILKLKPEGLMQAERLFDQGYVKEALQAVNDIEKIGGYSAQDRISCRLLRSNILIKLGRNEEGYKLAEQICRESQELGNYLQSVDALISVAKGYMIMMNSEGLAKAVSRAENLFDRISEKSLIEVQLRKVILDSLKGMSHTMKGDQEGAIFYHKKSLELGAKLGDKKALFFSLLGNAWHHTFAGNFDQALAYSKRCLVLMRSYRKRDDFQTIFLLATVYSLKGELVPSLKYFEQSLAIAEDLNNKAYISVVLNNSSSVYREKGELKKALMCLERNLEIVEDIGGDPFYSLDYLFIISFEMGAHEKAQLYLRRLQEINEKKGDKGIDVCCRVNEAIMLKKSTRTLNRAKAEELLRGIVDEDGIDMEMTVRAFIHLCDLLFTEFRMTKDAEVLDDVQTLVTQLFGLAEKQGSYSLMAEANLLRAKTELLGLNLKEARRFLTLAQSIADKHGLNRLARKISLEHDNLLKELGKWNKLKEENAPMDERLGLAGIKEQMDGMVQKREIKIIESPSEEPVLLLFLTKSGLPLFTDPLATEWDFSDDLFGGFLTAINAFSKEVFSEGLDRATFGRYTIIMDFMEPFRLCYVFKGQSYSAKEKLTHFSERVQNISQLWQTLIQSDLTHEVIMLKNNPLLEDLISDVFLR
ncbi:MAG: hypothetical protein ACTSWY_03910 [Promethearchaeota archaeon]